MYLEIVSPEAILFKGEVESLILPGSSGSFQLLNNHAPIVSSLKPGDVKIIGNIYIEKSVETNFISESPNVTLFRINSGTIEMKENKVILLSN
jgi:F-type H+-transporting ATPase subunit epsilon